MKRKKLLVRLELSMVLDVQFHPTGIVESYIIIIWIESNFETSSHLIYNPYTAIVINNIHIMEHGMEIEIS